MGSGLAKAKNMTNPKILYFGFGYCARVLASALSDFRAVATYRSEDARQTIEKYSVEAIAFEEVAPALGDVTHILASAPPTPEGDPVLLKWGKFLSDAADRLAWVGYLSTTGVYGDRNGGWVDEGSMLKPTGDRSRRRVEAERAWLALHRDRDVPVHVFRLPGIYGPGRNQIASVKAGTARRVIKKDQVFSRVHVEDIASVLAASMARPDPGAIYNVCDDEAAPPQDVVTYAAQLLGVEPPVAVPFDKADLTPMGRSFYADSKRVRNAKIKRELGVSLRYPTYREGLAALLKTEVDRS